MTDRHFWNEPNLKPTTVKRQHYVPRFYLQAFDDVDGKLEVRDLERDTPPYRTSVVNAAVESNFNNVEIAGRTLSTEDWLADPVEGNASVILCHLIEDPSSLSILPDDEEIDLARFLAALKFRGPAFRAAVGDLQARIAREARDIATKALPNQIGRRKAKKLLKEWENKPDHWWLGHDAPVDVALTAANLLAEVQGYGNLLRAMSWRIGRVPNGLRLTTTDTPLAGHLTPIRPWWDHGEFTSFTYYFALSPTILLKIQREPEVKELESTFRPHGTRLCADFSFEEIVFAQLVITREAYRFLYGDGPKMSAEGAAFMITVLDQAALDDAIKNQGFDPNPPQIRTQRN